VSTGEIHLPVEGLLHELVRQFWVEFLSFFLKFLSYLVIYCSTFPHSLEMISVQLGNVAVSGVSAGDIHQPVEGLLLQLVEQFRVEFLCQ